MDNKVLKDKLEKFINRFDSQSDQIKSQIHYRSVLNITNQLIKIYNKEESETSKKLLSDFLDQAIKVDLPLGKLESIELYRIYLLTPGKYLSRQKDFSTRSAVILKNLIGGVILDLVVFYFLSNLLPFYFPIFSVGLGFAGLRWQKIAVKENRIFGIGY